MRHGLPDEDGAGPPRAPVNPETAVVAVIRYPTASNLDEFKALEQYATVRWARSAADLEGAAIVVLPGSKHVTSDLHWLLDTDLPPALIGKQVLGICGGMQMLGEEVAGQPALGLLPLTTTFADEKRTERTSTRFNGLQGAWSALSGLALDGYEIRHGRTRPTGPVQEVLPDGLGYQHDAILGIYVHGLFEQPRTLAALFGTAQQPERLEQVFDDLADMVEERLDLELLLRETSR